MKKIPNKDNPIFLFWRILWPLCFGIVFFGLIGSFFSLNTGLTGMTPPMLCAVFAFIAAVGLPIYLLPAYFAFRKGMAKRTALLWVNILLGWTVAGYIASCVWCYRAK